jgi:uncharacterized protein
MEQTTLLTPMSVPAGMRPFSKTVILCFIGLFSTSLLASVFAETPFPKPSGPVNDFAEVITAPCEKRMSNLAKELLAKTGASLVLVTMRDLGGADSTQYASRLYSAWGIGKTKEDKGVLILVSVREQRMRIFTGTGLKALLSPRQLAEIQDRFVAPLLKQNNYDDGLLNGVVAIAKIISKEAGVTIAGEAAPKAGQESRSGFMLPLGLLVLGAVLLAFGVRKISRRNKSKSNRVKTQG